MPLITNDRAACEAEIRRALLLESATTNLQEEFLAAVVDACEEEAEEEGDTKRRLELRIGRWVILDNDLDLFKVTRDAVLALAPAHFLFSGMGEAGVASLIYSLLQVARNMYRGGALLTAEQIQLLLMLKAQK